MCGIAGFVDRKGRVSDPGAVIRRMADRMHHRGPDDEGFLIAPPAFLGHRRLSIIDLSSGRQPISNEEGDVHVIFNGEIYNFLELKKSLSRKGHKFKTNSDTEVIVHQYEEDGCGCFEKLHGMFAVAIWDQRDETLLLARDRFGKKPLYYFLRDGVFAFASELTSLLEHPCAAKEIDLTSLRMYLLFDAVPTPHTIIKETRKLHEGCYLSYRAGEIRTGRFYDIKIPSGEIKISEEEAVEKLWSLFKNSVKKRLISDVPLGVFLSGGIDSSAVVAAMSEEIPSDQIKTFTIGFAEKSFDESRFGRIIADHFRTDHREEIITAEAMLREFREIVATLDEPLADNSYIPTFVLSRFVRKDVKTALGGDGGDELFLGYPTFQAEKAAGFLYPLMPKRIIRALKKIALLLPVSFENISLDFKIKRFLDGLAADPLLRHFVWIGGLNPADQARLLANQQDDSDLFGRFIRTRISSPDAALDLKELSRLYMKIYLQDDILAKVDRASMANSLEVRAPLLDHEFVDFVQSIPLNMRMKGLRMKYLLKKALRGKVPDEILNRSKKGFGLPVGIWLRGELKWLLDEYLNEDRTRKGGFFKPEAVKRMVSEHLSGKRDNRKPLYSLIVFEIWRETNRL